jgi:hypothetical protein
MAKRRRPPYWDLVLKRVGRILLITGHPHMAQISENGTRRTRSSRHCVLVACRAKRPRGLWVTQCQAFQRAASEMENDKDRPKLRLIGKEVFPLPSEPQR